MFISSDMGRDLFLSSDRFQQFLVFPFLSAPPPFLISPQSNLIYGHVFVCVVYLGLFSTSGENFMSIGRLEIYLLTEMSMCSYFPSSIMIIYHKI